MPLEKREVFGLVVQTPKGVMPIGYKWVFVYESVRRKMIMKKLGIDYEETYFPIVDVITFRFFINLLVTKRLDMHLIDIVTAYLYGSLGNDIYIKIIEWYKMLKACNSKSQNIYSIKLQRSLYELKQSGCKWYNLS